MTNADYIIQSLQAAGVERLFGMPGGGSNADLIEAARRANLPFCLAHTETASAFMASAQAEITGKPGACLATLGPGAASIMNGVANAHLERIPLIVMTDCQPNAAMQHQNLPHARMFGPLVKSTGRDISSAIECAFSFPQGPVHLDLSTEFTSAPAPDVPRFEARSAKIAGNVPAFVANARRPVFLVGLGARTNAIASAIRELSETFSISALVTYKAKGVVPDQHPWFGGVFTNGTLEREVVNRADLILAIGLDPVELLPKPWKFPQRVVSITSWAMHQQQIPLAAEVVGDIAASLENLELQPSDWDRDELAKLVNQQKDRMRPAGEPGKLLPHRVAEIVAESYAGARITVDAGAHMFPILALWPATEPCGVLISNGLSTMGFALPAAIGAALLDTSKPVVAFTGDGGVLMCLAELRTATRENLRVRVVVFDDGDLTLIKIKQEQRGYHPDGVTIGDIDWRAIGAGFGVAAFRVETEESLRKCLRETVHHPGPVLIAAKISPSTYEATMQALRG